MNASDLSLYAGGALIAYHVAGSLGAGVALFGLALVSAAVRVFLIDDSDPQRRP